MTSQDQPKDDAKPKLRTERWAERTIPVTGDAGGYEVEPPAPEPPRPPPVPTGWIRARKRRPYQLDEDRHQFSLAELLGLVAFVSVWFSAMKSLPPLAFGALMNLAMLASVYVLHFMEPRRAIIYFGCWATLCIYALYLLMGAIGFAWR
ncbi:MAG: hypothetical protein ACYC35_02670 [Pirellulales bacterium]|jgi:hypothetical protein